jgi:hypothetical protein
MIGTRSCCALAVNKIEVSAWTFYERDLDRFEEQALLVVSIALPMI